MERAEKAEVVGQALAWPVIREADPALSSHSGKQSKQGFTIAGLSDPFTDSFSTSIQLSARMCTALMQGHLAAAAHGILADFNLRKQRCCKGQKRC